MIREVYHELIEVDLRFQSKAIETLQKMTKAWLIAMYED